MDETPNTLPPVEMAPLKNIKDKERANISNQEWFSIDPNDLWVYNKLELSKRLDYNCGPCGVDVLKPNNYIVRPAINFCGMGRFCRIEYLNKSTDHLHPGEFWCEIFEGEHLSVDFINKKSVLVVKGHKNKKNPAYMWNCWVKLERQIEFPEVLNDLVGDYSCINCEFIGGKLIEVQFRKNLDFRWGNRIAIPVWSKKNIKKKLKFIEDPDFLRLGFLIDSDCES